MDGEMITRTLELKTDNRLTLLEINKRNKILIKALYGGKVYSDCGNVYVKIVASEEACDQLTAAFANAVDVLDVNVVEDKMAEYSKALQCSEKVFIKKENPLLIHEQVS